MDDLSSSSDKPSRRSSVSSQPASLRFGDDGSMICWVHFWETEGRRLIEQYLEAKAHTMDNIKRLKELERKFKQEEYEFSIDCWRRYTVFAFCVISAAGYIILYSRILFWATCQWISVWDQYLSWSVNMCQPHSDSQPDDFPHSQGLCWTSLIMYIFLYDLRDGEQVSILSWVFTESVEQIFRVDGEG